MSQLPDRYNPENVEARIYAWWKERDYFRAQDQSTKPPFSIIMPPPNVTGFLHMGHALDNSIQDCVIRWKRMSGFNALWLPGTDHAGIATQVVVEKELKKKDGKGRRELGREKFVEKVWEWKHEYGDRILKQLEKLGASCDWHRSKFTLDADVSRAVRKVFVTLFKKNLVYRGKRLVNWSPPLESAISDLEVEFREVQTNLWHLKYRIDGTTDQFLVVATTRPETLLGDVAVCVHPEDERYKNLVGKKVIVPLSDRRIPIIADVFVDPAFGSGVVKITPAHDFTDYKVGQTHKLPLINILTPRGELNENGGDYKGLKVTDARKKIVEDLKAANLLEKEEPYKNNVGHCERTGAVVEPYLSDQWFVRMATLATPARRVVESETVLIEPQSWTKVYLHWLSNIEDWCISRQLWWGHRIPAWFCDACEHITVSETDPVACEKCASSKIHQADDVLDTWFSSALWPMSTLGWPDSTEALKTFYPTNMLVTGHDILFFWVARMVIMGIEFQKDIPFRKIFLHGLVRDAQGRKMSKSLGNSIDPVAIIEKFGADALRFSLLAHLHSGKDLKISEPRIEGYRNFMNKIWNASRFALQSLEPKQILASNDGVISASLNTPSRNQVQSGLPESQSLSIYDRWIIFKFSELLKKVEENFENHRFSDVAQALYSFTWYEFCDWYLELSKPALANEGTPQRAATQTTLFAILNRLIRMLHPFTPFITEEIYQKLPFRTEACMTDSFPTLRSEKEFLKLGSHADAEEVDLLREIVSAIRNIRGENRLSPALQIRAILSVDDSNTQRLLDKNKTEIVQLGRLSSLEISQTANSTKCAVAPIVFKSFECQVVIPLEGLVDFTEELKRLQKQIEKTTKDIAVLEGRLNNENFVKNATEEVVEADRKSLTDLRIQSARLSDSVQRFS